MKNKLIPRDLSPMDELCLCNRLTTPGTLQKIENEVLGGNTIEDLIVQKGWNLPSGILQRLKSNRQDMADRRDNVTPTQAEAKYSAWVIRQTIFRLSKGRKGWHMISKDYVGFRLLFNLMGEINDDPQKVSKLTDIVFPTKEYKTDSENSFFLLEIDTR